MRVLYDGACPYCATEIRWYRLLNDKSIEWIDITRNPDVLNRLGVSYHDAMQELHVVDEAGARHLGVDGFHAIWARLPVYRHISRILRRMPFMQTWMKVAYGRFAAWRVKRRSSG